MARRRDTAGETPKENAIAVHPFVAADAAVGRAAARLGVGYVLRTLQLLAQEVDGDLMAGLVLYTILAANVGHLDQNPAASDRFASLEDFPPDSVRRPVSVLGVAGSLGLPYETVRRQVRKLEKLGHCVRVKGGVVSPLSATLRQGADEQKMVLTNAANLRRLLRALKRAGFEFD